MNDFEYFACHLMNLILVMIITVVVSVTVVVSGIMNAFGYTVGIVGIIFIAFLARIAISIVDYLRYKLLYEPRKKKR